MKVIINKCYGGFGLSHQAEMEYAKRKGIKLYPFIEKRDNEGNLDFHHFRPYKKGKAFLIHYATKPLNKDGTYKKESYYPTGRSHKRNDPILVKLVEKMGKKANGIYAELSVVEIPDGIEYKIEEYDGMEWVSEQHETWG